MLKDQIIKTYKDSELNCAESVIFAANDYYKLGLDKTGLRLFTGYGGGNGCGKTCGLLTSSIAILSHLYGDKPKEEFRPILAKFIDEFETKLGSSNCEPISAVYKTEEEHCLKAVVIAAELLEDFIARQNAELAKTNEEALVIASEDIKRVKGMGFIRQKDTNKFNARVITRNGRITTVEMDALKKAADMYGDGHVMLTTRLTIEVSGIDYCNIDKFCEEIAKAGLETGGTGSRVRPVVSCKGTTCQYGLYDTYALSEEIHNRFYKAYHNVSLPHKFKIATGGCPNNCVKPELNDLGIVGAKRPVVNAGECRGCKNCQVENRCPIKVAKVEDGKIAIDPNACNNCGLCVGKCPFHCIDEAVSGWKIYIGGRWGKKSAKGQMLNKFFTSKDEVLDTVEKTILFFRTEGITGERLADTLNRVGFEKANEMILGNEMLERKAEILGIEVKGGATC